MMACEAGWHPHLVVEVFLNFRWEGILWKETDSGHSLSAGMNIAGEGEKMLHIGENEKCVGYDEGWWEEGVTKEAKGWKVQQEDEMIVAEH